MSFTYSPPAPTLVNLVRLQVADTDSTHPVFQDEEITMAASLETGGYMAASSSSSGSVISTINNASARRVAACMLDALAANKARLSAALEVLDIKIDPSKAAQALQKQAAYLREVESESGFFAIAETVYDPFTWRSRVWNEWLRQFGG